MWRRTLQMTSPPLDTTSHVRPVCDRRNANDQRGTNLTNLTANNTPGKPTGDIQPDWGPAREKKR